MSINIEQIDLIRKRANVSYEEAKEALEKNDDNLVEALVYLEQKNKTKSFKNSSGFIGKLKTLFNKSMEYKFLVYKKSEVAVKLPLLVFILLLVFACPFTIIALLLSLISGWKLKFMKKETEIKLDGVVEKINNSFDSISENKSECE
ncbi:hypothetical protein SH2C18_39360 [Clostridium sediminicola]|uniref:DUF4342 domain-containing protein n=1 Tax=Clostridium sediminicola TaxID=3114879 RepID=UPI0031F22A57